MDVVYNHMYRNENPLNSTVPYYFFRQNPDGSFSNGSGCGNEFASERPMARKYLIDSVLYWAQEYHIDGFRFDLMGLYDVDTMNELRAALDALPGGRSILMYGEPWQGGGSSCTGTRPTRRTSPCCPSASASSATTPATSSRRLF